MSVYVRVCVFVYIICICKCTCAFTATHKVVNEAKVVKFFVKWNYIK